MQKATASFNHLQLQKLYFLATLARLLLQLHNHNPIYTPQRLVRLRENSHPRGTPILGGSAAKRGAGCHTLIQGLFDSRFGLTRAIRQATFGYCLHGI